jgi:hypothetical protein
MDYQGNTRKERDKAEKKDKPEKEKIEKVVTEEVILKPRPLGKRFKEIFFGGDAKQAVKFVSADVLLPALRNLVVDMITKGAERMVYGENQYRRRPSSGAVNYGARYQYPGTRAVYPFERQDRAFSSNPIAAINGPLPSVRQNRHEMNDVILGTKEEAELVAERLIDILEKYDVASLADLYDLLGLETSHIDNKWGWTFLGSVQVRQIRQGYLLELPPLEEI